MGYHGETLHGDWLKGDGAEDAAEAARRMAEAGGEALAERTRRHTPVGTGRMRASIRAEAARPRVLSIGNTWEVEVTSDDPAFEVVEEGHGWIEAEGEGGPANILRWETPTGEVRYSKRVRPAAGVHMAAKAAQEIEAGAAEAALQGELERFMARFERA
jgi:hypothetical protein